MYIPDNPLLAKPMFIRKDEMDWKLYFPGTDIPLEFKRKMSMGTCAFGHTEPDPECYCGIYGYSSFYLIPEKFWGSDSIVFVTLQICNVALFNKGIIRAQEVYKWAVVDDSPWWPKTRERGLILNELASANKMHYFSMRHASRELTESCRQHFLEDTTVFVNRATAPWLKIGESYASGKREGQGSQSS